MLFRVLGKQEEEVSTLHSLGKTNTEIGKELNIARTTVGDIINRHSGKYRCEVCSCSFGSSYRLRVHKKSQSHLKKVGFVATKVVVEEKILKNSLPSYTVAMQLSKACLQMVTKFEEIANAFKVLESEDFLLDECERLRARLKGLVEEKKIMEKKSMERSLPILSEDSLNGKQI